MINLRASAAAAAVAVGLLSSAAHAVPAVFFNDDLAAGRNTLLNAIDLSDQAYNTANPTTPRTSTVFEIDITNSLTNASGVFTVANGATTVWVRTTQAGNIALNSSNGDLGGDGFTNWGNSYGGGFAGAEALAYQLDFFADAGLTTPFDMNAVGLNVNDWGTCCTSGNPTPLGGTANASEIYLRFLTGGTDSLLLLGGIAQGSENGGIEHFIGAINDTNFFNSVRVIATGNGEFFGAGGILIFSSVEIGSTPPGLSVISGGGLIGSGLFYWDGAGPAGDGIVQGGDGTWTATSTNFTDQGGTATGANTPVPSTPIFGGTGGTVTVDNSDGAITVTGMTFDVDGYTITGDPVTLSGPTATFTVTNAGDTAIVENDLLGGAVITKAGDGALRITGDLDGSQVLLNSGSLEGTGTIAGFVAADGSTVAPGTGGTSVGTLSVNGGADFQSGSTYAVNLAGNGTGDLIAVDGAATVATGTALVLTRSGAAPLPLNTRFTVLSATGGVTGSFSSLTGDTRVSQFFTVLQETDANNIYLGVRQTSSFASVAATPNQLAVATGADTTANGTLFNALGYLQSAGEARDAFDQLSGELHSTARGQTVQDSRFVREAVSAIMQQPGERKAGLWVSGYGSWGSTDADGNAARAERDIGGFFVGLETGLGEDAVFGVLAGYGSATIRVGDRGSNASTDDLHVGAYAGINSGVFYGHLGVAHMWRNLDTRRSVSFAGFSDTLTDEYQTTLTQVFAEVGAQVKVSNAFAISPFAQAAYVDATTDVITETGGAARLTSTGKTGGDFWVTTLGARLQYGLPVGSGNFGVTAEAGWRHIGGGNETTPINFALPGGPAFNIAGVPFGRDVAALGLIVSGQVASNVLVDFGYRGQVGKDLKDHGVRGGVIIRF